MAKTTAFKVYGLKEIEQSLKKLPGRVQRKVKQNALQKGGNVVAQRMRENIRNIPEDRLSASGKERYAKSIGNRARRDRRHEATRQVGPRYGGSKNIFPEAHLFEFGTTWRVGEKDGKSRGRILPLPVLRKSWEEARKEAVDAVRIALAEGTLKEAIKLRKL